MLSAFKIGSRKVEIVFENLGSRQSRIEAAELLRPATSVLITLRARTADFWQVATAFNAHADFWRARQQSTTAAVAAAATRMMRRRVSTAVAAAAAAAVAAAVAAAAAAAITANPNGRSVFLRCSSSFLCLISGGGAPEAADGRPPAVGVVVVSKRDVADGDKSEQRARARAHVFGARDCCGRGGQPAGQRCCRSNFRVANRMHAKSVEQATIAAFKLSTASSEGAKNKRAFKLKTRRMRERERERRRKCGERAREQQTIVGVVNATRAKENNNKEKSNKMQSSCAHAGAHLYNRSVCIKELQI